jgi:hypothetical protein
MKQYLFGRRSIMCGIVTAVVSCLGAGSALAAQLSESGLSWGSASACSAPSLSQPFGAAHDSNWYTPVAGESPDSFDGTGWALSGGASIKHEPLADGHTGSVLDLPSGSVAISPPMCVSSGFPTARTMVRDVSGAEGVQVYVGYAGTQTAAQPQNTGQVHGQQTAWTLSDPFNVQPGNSPGWQLMRFTLVSGGQHSDFQVYDFYVDPRMKF